MLSSCELPIDRACKAFGRTNLRQGNLGPRERSQGDQAAATVADLVSREGLHDATLDQRRLGGHFLADSLIPATE